MWIWLSSACFPTGIICFFVFLPQPWKKSYKMVARGRGHKMARCGSWHAAKIFSSVTKPRLSFVFNQHLEERKKPKQSFSVHLSFYLIGPPEEIEHFSTWVSTLIDALTGCSSARHVFNDGSPPPNKQLKKNTAARFKIFAIASVSQRLSCLNPQHDLNVTLSSCAYTFVNSRVIIVTSIFVDFCF